MWIVFLGVFLLQNTDLNTTNIKINAPESLFVDNSFGLNSQVGKNIAINGTVNLTLEIVFLTEIARQLRLTGPHQPFPAGVM